MTEEASGLLAWITRRGRATRNQVLMLGPPQYRRLRRLCLDELMQGGYVLRVDGWYMKNPAHKPSQEGR